jgi:hypothetical protein
VLEGLVLVVVDIDLDDLQVVALAAELVEHGADRAAGSAPGRPEVDEDRFV